MKRLIHSSARAGRLLALLLLSLFGLHAAWSAGRAAPSAHVRFAVPGAGTLPQYTIQDLGPVAPNSDDQSSGYGLNNEGHVLGYGGDSRGAFWNPGVFRIDPIRNGPYDVAGQLDQAFNLSASASINDNDMVVGYSYLNASNNAVHAFRWDQILGTIDLGSFGVRSDGYSYSGATAINAGGYVVGISNDYNNGANGTDRAFLWSPTTDGSGNLTFNPDGSFGTLLNLGTLSPNINGQDGFDGDSLALGINSRNQVAGYASSNLGGGEHAFLYDGAMHDLGTLYPDPNSAGSFYGNSQALGINENGALFGDTDTLGGHDGFVHIGTGFLASGDDIGYLSSVSPRSYALGINGANAVCGYSYADGVNTGIIDFSTRGYQRAIAYDGTLHDLGSLGVYDYYYASYGSVSGYFGLQSQARAINDSDQVVGYSEGGDGQNHAFVYRDGLMYGLDHLLTGPDSANWQLRDATGINASGQITGYGLHFNGSYNESHAYLLTPAPATTILPAPSISSLYIASALAGDPDFTLSVNGAGFAAGSVVHFNQPGAANDTTLTTTAQSDSLLYAAVPAALVAAPGAVNVTVTNPDGQTSAAATFTVYAPNPQPTITGISPDRTPVKTTTDVTITLTGTNFVAGPAALESQVYFDGNFYTPTSVSADGTSLTFTAPVADNHFSSPHQASVFVRNPRPAPAYPDKDSATVPFYVTNLVPTIDHFSPDHATAGSPDLFILYVYGTGLNSGSQVQVNGSARSTSYDAANDRLVVFYIYPADIATAGNLPITVINNPVLPTTDAQYPDGGTAEKDLPVTSADNPQPTVTALDYHTAPANQDLSTDVYGTGFVQTSTVKLIDQADGSLEDTLTPSPIGASTSLYVTLPAADLKLGHTYTVVVSNPAPGGGDSDSSTQAATTLAVGNPVPTVTALSPVTVQAGSADFPLTLTGTNFMPGATVSFNGATLTPTAITPTQITVTVPQAQVATQTTFYVYVSNPALNTAPAYGSSGTYFTVTSPTPTLTAVDPNAGVLKTAETVTVTGSNFSTAFGTYLYLPNYGGIAPTSISPDGTSMTVDLPAGVLNAVGTQNVYVANSGPITGGGSNQSATLPFTTQASPNPVPTVTGLSAHDKPVGSPGFYLSVYGTNFVPGAKIKFNGVARMDTTFVSSGELNTRISNAEMQTATTDTVTVANPAPGGGDSTANSDNLFTVGNPKPTLSALTPSSAPAGSAGFRLHITGTGFIAATTVSFGADTGLIPVVSTLASTALDVDIPAGDLTTAGTVNVTVTNPAPDGGTSGPLSFTISPVIVLSSLTFTTPVPGGTVLYPTVTLNAVTPTDVVVGLSSSDSATVRLHRAVIITAGSQSATFELDTFRSHVTKTVTIRATLGAVVLTKDVTITGR